AAAGEGLGIEAEVEDDFFGGGRDPAEIGVGRERRGIVDDHLGDLGLRVLLRRHRRRSFHGFSAFFFVHVTLPSGNKRGNTGKRGAWVWRHASGEGWWGVGLGPPPTGCPPVPRRGTGLWPVGERDTGGKPVPRGADRRSPSLPPINQRLTDHSDQ